jgi:hypothetical protein
MNELEKASGIYLGNRDVKAVYLGSVKIWPTTDENEENIL